MPNTDFRRGFLRGLAGVGAAGVAATGLQAAAEGKPPISVSDHGAAGDGIHMDTRAIQAAIDACAQGGGGSVCFPPGTYLSGTIFLKSRVRLCLEFGATLLGSKNLGDYPVTVPALRSYTDNYTDKSLLYGENLEDVVIEGRGVIDGQGAAFQGPYKVRPYMMRFVSCRNVSVTDVVIRDSPMWVQHYLDCEGVFLRGLTVRSRVNRNNDGIDIDCCRRVRISDCDISSGDDAIVLKSTSSRPARDIAISNCVLSSHCNALKMGTESNGGFENIAINNCAIYDTRLAGIALEIVDGGTMDGIAISNVTMSKVECPIFIRLGDRARPFEEGGPLPKVGSLRNVVIANVEATGANNIGCAISGIPGHNIENVTLANIRLRFAGGGTQQQAEAEVPENAAEYPEYRMFGTLPAYAFYCRHAKNVNLSNVRTQFEPPEERPALICDDVEGLQVEGSEFGCAAGGGPVMRLIETRDAFLRGNRIPAAVRTGVQVAGRRTARVTLIGNDLALAQQAVEPGADVGSGSIFLAANHLRG